MGGKRTVFLITDAATTTRSSTLAWKIPRTEGPGRLQSMVSLRVGQDWATSLSLFTFMHWRRKWQPTPVFLPGESQGRGAWWATLYGVAQSRIRLKQLSSSSCNNWKSICKQKKKKVDPCHNLYVKLLTVDHRSKFLKLKTFRVIHRRKPLGACAQRFLSMILKKHNP